MPVFDKPWCGKIKTIAVSTGCGLWVFCENTIVKWEIHGLFPHRLNALRSVRFRILACAGKVIAIYQTAR